MLIDYSTRRQEEQLESLNDDVLFLETAEKYLRRSILLKKGWDKNKELTLQERHDLKILTDFVITRERRKRELYYYRVMPANCGTLEELYVSFKERNLFSIDNNVWNLKPRKVIPETEHSKGVKPETYDNNLRHMYKIRERVPDTRRIFNIVWNDYKRELKAYELREIDVKRILMGMSKYIALYLYREQKKNFNNILKKGKEKFRSHYIFPASIGKLILVRAEKKMNLDNNLIFFESFYLRFRHLRDEKNYESIHYKRLWSIYPRSVFRYLNLHILSKEMLGKFLFKNL